MLYLLQLTTPAATLSLAVHDYCVVALAAVGWFFVGRMLSQRDTVCADVAFFGLALITLGGVARASWTLVAALWGLDIEWLGNALFPLLVPGFICVAWAIWCGFRPAAEPNLVKIWLVPLTVSIAAFVLAAVGENSYAGRGWFIAMVGLVTLANLLLVMQLIYHAIRWHEPWAVGCFVAHLGAVFLLARISDQADSMHFFKQNINLLSQIFLLAAAFMLQRRARRFVQFA